MRVVCSVCFVVFFVLPLAAQAPAAPAAPAGLDAGDKLLVSTLVALIEAANADCQALESVKSYATQKAQADQFLGKKYPGYVVNYSTQQLVAQKPAAPTGK